MSDIVVIGGFIAVLCGAISYSLADRKGMPRGEAFLTGLLLGPLGLLFVITKVDVRPGWVQPPFQEKPVGIGGMFIVALTCGVIAAVIAYVILK